MDLGLEGKVALVMGASRGLGLACAQALSREGCTVAMAARGKDSLEAAAADLGGKNVSIHLADASVPLHRERLVNEAINRHGRIDVLITNSGGPRPGAFDAVDEAAWVHAHEVVVGQVAHLSRLAAPGMRQRKWGRIINIISSSYKEPISGLVLSNTYRPAVVGLAKTLSQELGPHGITVNNVAPGRFDTDRLREVAKARAKGEGGTLEEWMGRFGKDSPVGRLGQAQELGDAVAFLASEAARYINGVTLPVDGGLLRSL
jgi:3-oxoacyl-[acyl-carrier protein] reductase